MSVASQYNHKRECSPDFSSRTTKFIRTPNKLDPSANKLHPSANKLHHSEDDIKDYAETTMNELLGWYGYDKLDTRETQNLNLQRFTSTNHRHRSSPVHSENAETSQTSKATSLSMNDIDGEESRSSSSHSVSVDGCNFQSHSPQLEEVENGKQTKESPKDAQNIPPGCILCAWCQKVGMKLFTMRTANGSKAFCSELCFTQNRRASFKKNKICDWCKHVRHTVNYVDFQDGETQLQFCSNKCLNQYKMNIFCKETQAHLQMHPHLRESNTKVVTSGGSKLITPDLWLKECKNGDNTNNIVMSQILSSDGDGDSDADNKESSSSSTSFKRKLKEAQNYSSDINDHKDTKESLIKEKTVQRDSKRHKHLSGKHHSHPNRHSSKYLSNSTSHANDWSSSNRDPRGEMPQNVPSSQRHHNSRFSPVNTSNASSAQRVSSGIAQNPIPLTNGTSIGVHNSMPIPAQNSGQQLFPPLSGALNRLEHLRAPLLPPPPLFPGAPSPNLFASPAHMEMLMRMHQGFSGLRHPFPFLLPPTNVPNAHPYPLPPNMINQHQPPLHMPNTLLPPATVMVPYPVVLPIPIPVPIPIPIIKNLSSLDMSSNSENIENSDVSKNNTHTTNASTNTLSHPNTLSHSNTLSSRKVESVITKLVERKAKANGCQNISVSGNCLVNNLDKKFNHRNNHHDDDDDDDDEKMEINVCDSTERQNLVISRSKRCVTPY